MGKGSGEIPLLLGCFLQRGNMLFQFLRHHIELLGQHADLVAGAYLGPDSVVAPGDLLGRAGQLTDRGGQYRSGTEADDQAHRHRYQVHHLEGVQVLVPHGVDLRYIVAALQVVGYLVHGEPADDHHIIHRALSVGHAYDPVAHGLLPRLVRKQSQTVALERGHFQQILHGGPRGLRGAAAAALQCHGAQHRTHELGLIRRSPHLMLQLGTVHRGYHGVARKAHGQGHNEHYGQGYFRGKLHPSPSSR